jgi:hypothetical protein
MTTAKKISLRLREIERLLLEKNAAYGDSAINPVRIFSQADPVEQLRVRIDDKLSRIARGNSLSEDTITDLIGYLVLLSLPPDDPGDTGHHLPD